MSQPETLIIAGSGASGWHYDYPAGVPIMAVSSGFRCVPGMRYFCSLDRPVHFPQWLLEHPDIEKHVTVRWGKYWTGPKVTLHETSSTVAEPNFSDSGTMTSCGCLNQTNSLLFTVQLAPRLGYRRLLFIGCDLWDSRRREISEELQAWYPLAQKAGIEWVNASPLSTLAEWMPPAEPTELLDLEQCPH